jgi:hypothetical protein
MIKKILDKIWNFLIAVGEVRAEAVKSKSQHWGH